MASNLTEELVARGHRVTLFASGGSRTRAELVTYFDRPLGLEKVAAEPLAELPHLLSAYQHAERFDVIHDHTFPLGPSIGANVARTPVVHTLHTPPSLPESRRIYELIASRVHLVAVAEHQRESMPTLNCAGTVYNGIRLEDYPFKKAKGDYLLFVGAMRPAKGVHLAVETARQLGRRLVLVTKMAEPAEFAYFNEQVRPRIASNVEIMAEISLEQKVALFADASATLMPIQWPEPFGLVMVESLACGTPVIAWRNGAATEIVQHGRTGFLADDLDGFISSVRRIDAIDASSCRAAVEARFTSKTMADGYEGIYNVAIREAKRSATRAPADGSRNG